MEAAVVPRSNTGLNIEIAKPQIFNGKVDKVSGFLIAYRLYIRMRIMEVTVKKQI